MVTVDLKNKYIPADHSVTVMRPGAQHKLYSEFHEFRRVGPELPAFFLAGEKLTNEPDRIIARIKRSRAVKKWWRFRGRDAAPDPSLDLDDYDDTLDQSVRQFQRVVDYYLTGAKVGDLVVMPSPKFDGVVQIGEYLSPRIREVNSQHHLEFPLWGREVAWIGGFPKTDLPGKVIDALRTPTALLLLGETDRNLIYRNAYRNFSSPKANSTVFDVGSPEFNTFHGSVIPAFFNFVAANMRSLEGGMDALSFSEAAFTVLDEFTLDLALDVQSPGTLTLASKFLTPLVAAVLLTLAVQLGPNAATAEVIDTIKVVNNGVADDQCALPVEESVQAYLRLLGYDKWADACEKIVTAAAQTELKTEAVLQ